MRLLSAANNQAARRNEIIKSYLQLGSSSNRYAPRLPQQETKSSTKQLPPTDPILGPENLLKTGFAQKGLPSSVTSGEHYNQGMSSDCVAREKPQQSLRTWIVSFYFESAVFQLATRWESGLYSGLQADPSFYYAAMHCRYFAETKTLWEHLNSSADIFQFGAVETVLFWRCVYYAASLSISTTARCWLCLIVSGRVPFLTRHGSLIHPEMNECGVAGYGWSLTQPCVTAQSLPLGRSP